MSNQDDLFDKSNSNPEGNENPDFTDLVGEGKKYSTVEKLASSAADAQRYISSLERERDELREDVSKGTSLDSILDHITSKNNQVAEQGTPPAPSQVNQGDITSLVRDEVTNLFKQDRQQSIYDMNRNKVQDRLKEKFGDKASEVLKSKAAEVGLTVEKMGELAQTSPQAVLEYFKDVTPSAQRTEGSFNTDSTSVTNSIKVGTQSYYNQIRKEDSTKYFSNKIQLEIQKSAKELGDAYYQ